jgi:hypothetical protein
MGNVLLHLGLGLAVAAGAFWMMRKRLADVPALASGAFSVSLALGIYLAIAGATRPNRWALWLHIATALIGVLALAFRYRRSRALVAAAVLVVAAPAATRIYARLFPDPAHRIVNPSIVPASMDEEGGGPKSPFFPSSAKTNVGGIIPANFFMDSVIPRKTWRYINDMDIDLSLIVLPYIFLP